MNIEYLVSRGFATARSRTFSSKGTNYSCILDCYNLLSFYLFKLYNYCIDSGLLSLSSTSTVDLTDGITLFTLASTFENFLIFQWSYCYFSNWSIFILSLLSRFLFSVSLHFSICFRVSSFILLLGFLSAGNKSWLMALLWLCL